VFAAKHQPRQFYFRILGTCEIRAFAPRRKSCT
jgi:hypothetical protein